MYVIVYSWCCYYRYIRYGVQLVLLLYICYCAQLVLLLYMYVIVYSWCRYYRYIRYFAQLVLLLYMFVIVYSWCCCYILCYSVQLVSMIYIYVMNIVGNRVNAIFHESRVETIIHFT